MNAPSIDPSVRGLLAFAATQSRHAEELARATGEHFNIFDILGIGHLEVKTHSPFLAELLSPSGTHGQGAIFLSLFLKRFEIEGFDAESNKANVWLEYHAGQVTEKSGGRIDILIQDCNGRTIVIENKIYADDQDKQMLRYRESYPMAHLFYLTLDGREPGDGEKVDGLRCISYAKHVLGWLQDCRKEAACVHSLRETIGQYIHLVQNLTHQNTSTRMSQELIKAVLQSEESYLAYAALRSAGGDIRSAIFEELNTRLRDVAKTLDLDVDRPFDGNGGKEDAVYFSNPLLRRQNFCIGLVCDKSDYRDFYFGFKIIDEPLVCSAAIRMQDRFRAEFGRISGSSDWWPVWLYCDPHRDWTDATYLAIRFGPFVDDFKKQLEKMVRISQHAQSPSMVPTTA